MDKGWQKIADRMVQGLGVRPGELIELRDGAGDPAVLREASLAIERAGATPLIRLESAEYLERVLSEAPLIYLTQWDQYRQAWMKQIDRILVLAGSGSDFSLAPPAAVEAWRHAQTRLTTLEEERQLPYLVVAIPTALRAGQLNVAQKDLEEILLPALAVSAEALRDEIERVQNRASQGQTITIHSGNQHVLHLEHGDRLWLSDDGRIDELDRKRGAIVSNLPAGSMYTTVLEEKTHGSLWLSRAGKAREVVFHFEAGRIIGIEAASGADLLEKELNSHSGEPRRVSHIGLGLNPYLTHPIGWTLVDEHVHGSLFIALGENRYMGGQNESSLNIDYALTGATLRIGDQTIISEGKIVV